MRPIYPENVLLTLLRQCYTTPRCQHVRKTPYNLLARHRQHSRGFRTCTARSSQRGQYGQDERGLCAPMRVVDVEEFGGDNGVLRAQGQTQSSSGPTMYKPLQEIAVLGGGITGLATAYYLSRELPKAKITLYEGSERVGGWLKTKHVDVGDGTVAFEQGPRSLRPGTPAGMVTLNLIKQLGLEDEILITPKDSPAARNRFIYYPDRLVKMPGPGQDLFDMAWTVMTQPAFKGLIPGVLFEHTRPPRPAGLEDESVASFMERRLGSSSIGDNMASAVLHGIYAGDITQLSMKSLLPTAWHNEGAYGSLMNAYRTSWMTKAIPMPYRDAILLQEMTSKPEDMAKSKDMNFASVYSFREGIQQLADELELALDENENVTIKTNEKITKVELDGQSDNMKITSSEGEPAHFDKVISTISGRNLSYLTTPHNSVLPSLQATHAVTVMVVNLYYRSTAILPEQGFGYLIPRSIPFAQNPERALGVVFDSDAVPGQDTVPGTKVTVMFGGHWWDTYDSYPDEEEGAAMAKSILKRHLGVEEEPATVNVGLQRNCIPQYTVGHDMRMGKAHHELLRAFKGKLAVAGNSYTGVGLNDCVRAARDTALDVAQYEGPGGITGLESFVSERRWVHTQAIRVPRKA